MLDRILKKAGLSDVLIVFVAAVGIIGIWRGLWNLMDAYVFPESFVFSQILTIVGGILVLAILSKYE